VGASDDELNAPTERDRSASPQTLQAFRTYPQCLWLYQRLQEDYPDRLLPTFPDRPTAMQSDPDYLEKKRLQMERFMGKLFRRADIVASDRHVSYFLSDTMVRGPTREAVGI